MVAIRRQYRSRVGELSQIDVRIRWPFMIGSARLIASRTPFSIRARQMRFPSLVNSISLLSSPSSSSPGAHTLSAQQALARGVTAPPTPQDHDN